MIGGRQLVREVSVGDEETSFGDRADDRVASVCHSECCSGGCWRVSHFSQAAVEGGAPEI